LLLVEDSPLLRQMLALELRDLGYRVTCADTCAEALERIRAGDYQHALLDLCLPDGTGIEVAEELLRETPAARAILFSGAAGFPASAGTDLPTNLVACLAKPANLGVIDALLRPQRPGSTPASAPTGYRPIAAGPADSARAGAPAGAR
jgi:DNA-binding response OmpR family regulator